MGGSDNWMRPQEPWWHDPIKNIAIKYLSGPQIDSISGIQRENCPIWPPCFHIKKISKSELKQRQGNRLFHVIEIDPLTHFLLGFHIRELVVSDYGIVVIGLLPRAFTVVVACSVCLCVYYLVDWFAVSDTWMMSRVDCWSHGIWLKISLVSHVSLWDSKSWEKIVSDDTSLSPWAWRGGYIFLFSISSSVLLSMASQAIIMTLFVKLNLPVSEWKDNKYVLPRS